jgi:uncharacterized membrane protein
MKQKWVYLALILITLLGLAIRLYELDKRTMTHIEISIPGIPLPKGLSDPSPRLTVMATLRSVVGAEDPNPPAYYLMMLAWTRITGTAIWWLRLPSVIFGTACILLVFMLGKLEKTQSSGLLAAFLVALNGHQIFWSQLAKNYIMAVFIGLAATIMLLLALKGGRRERLFQIIYLFLTLLGVFTTVYFWLILIVHMVWVLIEKWSERRLPGIFQVQYLALLAGTPLISLAILQARRASYLDPNFWPSLVSYLGFGYAIEDIPAGFSDQLWIQVIPYFLLTAGIIFLVAGFWQARQIRIPGQTRGIHPIFLLAVALLVTPPIFFAGKYFTAYYPQAGRNVMFSAVLPGLLFILYLCLRTIWQRKGGKKREFASESEYTGSNWKLSAYLAIVPTIIFALVTPVVVLFASRGIMLYTPYLLLLLSAGGLALIKRSRIWLPILLMMVMVLPVGSVLFRNSTLEHPTDYKGMAEKWIPELQDNDLIFVRKHWGTTPIFYYLDWNKYQVVGNLQPDSYAEALRTNPDSRVWVLSTLYIEPEASALQALVGYKITKTIETMDQKVELYEKQYSEPYLTVNQSLSQSSIPDYGDVDQGMVDQSISPTSTPIINDENSQQYKGYLISMSTYLGGADTDQARDVVADNQGNIYITGGTSSANFPHTVGPGIGSGTCQNPGSEGNWDVFVTKLSPTGKLVWSRFIGGPCYDRAYAIELDSQGNVYLAGRAGPGFPVTASAVQTNFQGYYEGIYGDQNAFIAMLSSGDGSLKWASYIGVSSLARDLAIDVNGDLFVPLTYSGNGVLPPQSWFKNTYQKTIKGGSENGVVKVTHDGSKVVWATWFGGSNDDSLVTSIRVNQQGVYFAFYTNSQDVSTTQGAFDRTLNGKEDFFIARLSLDGSSLLLGTYLGGSGTEYVNTHNLALGEDGTIYVSVWTDSPDYPTTPNAYQTLYKGGKSDIAITRLSASGGMIASTYLGGAGDDNSDGIQVDTEGVVYFSGNTSSSNFPVTNDAFQPIKAGKMDAFLAKLSPDLSQLIFSTFLGGSEDDDGRASYFDPSGNWYIAGTAESYNFPVRAAFQSSFAGGMSDCFLTKVVHVSNRSFLPVVRRWK